jgi:hypothetical protein
MNPRVTAVKPGSDYTLTLTFANGEVKVFDVKPYLDKGIFRELSDVSLFNTVRPCLGSVQWKNRQDFCPDTLYLDSRVSGRPISVNDNGETTDTTEAERPRLLTR